MSGSCRCGTFQYKMLASVALQLEDAKRQRNPNSRWGRLRGIVKQLLHQFWCVGWPPRDQRGLLSSNVINEHSLHIFARKHLQRTSNFLEVPPVHPRRVHKTGLPVSLNLEGHSLAVGGFLRPTVDHFQPSGEERSLLSRLPPYAAGVWCCAIRSVVSRQFQSLAMSKRVQRMIRPSCLPVTARASLAPGLARNQ